MTKRKYLRRLRKALGNIPAHEKDEIAEYYNELIEEALDRGKTESEIFAEMDTPEQAARNYLKDGLTTTSAPRCERSQKSAADVLLLPIRILCGFVLVILGIVTVSVTFSLGVAGISIGASGIWLFFVSFGPLFTGHPGIAFAQFGVAIALTGLCPLFIAVTCILWKLNVCLWNVFRGRENTVKPFKKSTIRSFAVGGAVFLLGILVFMGGFGAMGFRQEALAVMEGMVEQEQIVEEIPENFSFESDNLALTVKPSEDETLRIVYREVEDAPKHYSYEDGKMTLKESDSKVNVFFFGTSARTAWRRGVFFSWAAQDIHRAELYLPASFEGDLKLKTANGTISIADMVCSDLVLRTNNGVIHVENITANSVHAESDNGVVKFSEVTVSGLLYAQTDNGAMKLDRVNAGEIKIDSDNGAVKLINVVAVRVEAETNNGAINLERLSADDISMKADNGAISGTILGTKEEFRIAVSTGNGTCNLKDKENGEKSLRVRAGNGSIRIFFTD